MPGRRSRRVYLVLLAVTILLGLGSRIYRGSIPMLLDRYAGDTLWATAVVLLLGVLFPSARTLVLVAAAAAIALAVEVSQLAHPAWLDALRRMPGVGLVIGYDFVWVDLVCYAIGVALGGLVDAVAFRGLRRAFSTRAVTAACVVAAMLAVIAHTQLPMLGAGGLLHPARRPVAASAPEGCTDATWPGMGVQLAGWRCEAVGGRRGTIVYLHGIADNRAGAAGVIARFRPRGFDVIAYDSRAHGDSTGDACTYGFFEKQDLGRVLDTVTGGPIALLGTSLGGAVALQYAADDSRITTVIAAESFSDLRRVAGDRAPFFFTPGAIAKAFAIAEARAGFRVDDVSPRVAASKIRVPVLLVHGALDSETPAEHSKRIFDALTGSKELLLVPGVGHNRSLTGEVWTKIERWLDAYVPRRAPET